jgi:hypothetical protein
MSRARNIKPSLMADDDLANLPALTRLLFVFLPMLADREGKLEDRPARIAAQALPYDRDADVDGMLAALAAAQLIDRYRVDGKAYLQIRNFDRDQNPHMREVASEIPDNPNLARNTTPSMPDNLGDAAAQSGQGPAPGEPGESPGLAPGDPASAAPAPKPSRQASLAAITDDAIDAFNAKLARPHGALPQVNKAVGREKRQQQVKRILSTAADICAQIYQSRDITRKFWDDYFLEVDADDFKSGRTNGGAGHENWTPSFEYLTRAKTMIDVFDKGASADAGGPAPSGARAPKKHHAAEDFRGKRYEGTDVSKLPAYIREAVERGEKHGAADDLRGKSYGTLDVSKLPAEIRAEIEKDQAEFEAEQAKKASTGPPDQQDAA